MIKEIRWYNKSHLKTKNSNAFILFNFTYKHLPLPEVTSLTLYEKELVTNAEILYAKNSIIRKVSDLFAVISNDFMEVVKQRLPYDLTSVSPKISRGEQYLGLPYVMLDYPRNFARHNTFAIRTFFWWGHFFSIHLQLSGNHQIQHAAALQGSINKGNFNGWHIGVSDIEWHHHFENDNYQLISGEVKANMLRMPFIKLAKKIPLTEWDKVPMFLNENFKVLITELGY